MKRLIIQGVLLLTASLAQAEVYKWVDANGTIHFESSPQTGAKNVERKQYDAPAILPGISMRSSIPNPTKTTTPTTDERSDDIEKDLAENREKVLENLIKYQAGSTNIGAGGGAYTVSKSVSANRKSVTISGRIEGGKPCKNLIVTAFATNDKGEMARIKTQAGSIGNGVRSALFSGTDNKSYEISPSGWFVSTCNVKCGD